MSLWESILVALQGLRANKMRSSLTALGVIIGVSAVITMLAIATGARESMMQRIQGMGTNILFIRPGQSRSMGVRMRVDTLTMEDSDAIAKECRLIAQTAPEISTRAQVKYGNVNSNLTIVGTSFQFPDIRNYDIDAGRFFSESEQRAAKKVAVLGPTVVDDMFEGSNPIGKRIRIRGILFQVIGVTAEKGAGGFGDPDNQIYIPITTAMKRVFGLEYVNSIAAQAVSDKVMDKAQVEIEELLRKRHKIRPGEDDDFHVRNQADILEMANEAAGIFTLLLGGIASVSLVVGGIGIMNIMLVSVTERTREIGIRMAVGARRRDIQRQFLVEALVLSLMGGVVGILLGAGASALITHFSTLTARVSAASVAMSFSFAAIVGIVFGVYPAQRAASLNPIDALRYE